MAGEAVITLDINEWELLTASITGKLRSVSKLLRAVYGTIGYRDIIKHFEDESGPNGPWKPRSESTQKAYARIAAGFGGPRTNKAKYNPSNKILQLSGDLRKSIS